MKIRHPFSLTVLLLSVAYAADPPKLKEGLWSVHSESTGNPGNVKNTADFNLCRDHAYDDLVRTRDKSIRGCTVGSDNFADGKLTTEIHCNLMGVITDSKTVTSYQGDTATHSETEATFEPAKGGLTDQTTITDQKYIGACPAGMKPGTRSRVAPK